MSTIKKIALCLLTVSAAFPAFAQVTGDPLVQLKQRFEANQKEQPETILMHTDRSFYVAGDTIWYKVYVLESQTFRPNPATEVLYLDLISEANRNIVSQRVQSENGFKAASLILPDTLKAGSYLLQVYSNRQRNIGREASCRQVIWVNQVPQQSAKTVGKTPGKVPGQLKFYPEGGTILAGFESKVAFKALAGNNEAVSVEGKVIEETGKTVATFRSDRVGFGNFTLTPKAGKTYRAQVFLNGEKKEFPLEVAEKGYALSVKNTPDSVTVQMAVSGNTGAPAYLVLQRHGQLIAADSVLFNAKGRRKRIFAAGSWPEGPVQVRLLNAAQKPESERLFFHRNALQVKLETTKKAYARREPVTVNLRLTDKTGRPIEAEFSVSVTSNLPMASPSLRQKMLLGSEIKVVPDLLSDNPTAVDNFLLTQELEKLAVEPVAQAENNATFITPEADLNQTGLVTENGELIKNAVLYLLETHSGKTYLLTSNAEAKFKVPAEGNSFFYQIWQNGVRRENAVLTLPASKTPLAPANWPMALAIDSAETNRLLLRRQIENMYTPENPKLQAQVINKEKWPAYQADAYYPLQDYTQFNTMEEILREMVPAVRVITRKKKVQVNVQNKEDRTFFPNQPLYVIDGQPTWNNDLFLRLDASQLDQVNVYYSPKALQPFGFMGNNGVIVVFTKSRNYQNPDLQSENMLKVPGQNANNRFVRKDRPVNIPDFRPTLYWNPELKTNAEGKASFTFKTSDEIGQVRVQVEGVTKDGRLISETLLIPVQPAE